MTTGERNSLGDCMDYSTRLPGAVFKLSTQIGRAITNATTPEHRERLEALHKHTEDARQLLIAVHDELAEMYQRTPSDAKTGE